MTDQHTLPRGLWLLLGALTLFWGFNWPMMKLARAELLPWTFRAACLACGAAGLFFIARAQGLQIQPREGQWKRLAFASLFNVTGWNLLIAYGVSILPSGRSAILAYTMPLWTVILSALFLRERFTRRKHDSRFPANTLEHIAALADHNALLAIPFDPDNGMDSCSFFIGVEALNLYG